MGYKYEKYFDLFDQSLSEVFITVKEHEMSVYSKLFSVWSGGDPEIRSNKRQPVGAVENNKMQSFFKGWI